MNKETKKLIRQLRKLKKQTQVGTEQRRDINRKIRALKEQAGEQNLVTKDNPIIEEIYKLKPEYKTQGFDLRNYTEEQLKKHLEYIKRKQK